MIKVRLKINRFGHLIGVPVSHVLDARFRADVVANGGPYEKFGFYLQHDTDVFQLMDEYPRRRSELREGWWITVLMDPDDCRAYYGWRSS